MAGRAFWAFALGCVFLPGAAQAQPIAGSTGVVGLDASGRPYASIQPDCQGPRVKPGYRVVTGAGFGNFGYPYGPRVAPPWGYPGLVGGPYVGYPYPGFFGYSGRVGNFWSNGLSLYGPPVPTYGPLPGVLGNGDLEKAWRQHPGIPGFGWFGIYAPSPRPRYRTVSVQPRVEAFAPPGAYAPGSPQAAGGGCLVLSVKVPQPAAEVIIDGRKTAQTGTDRTFESPPLEASQTYKYTVTARWAERGQVFEMTKEVTGAPGEVVRVDFSLPFA